VLRNQNMRGNVDYCFRLFGLLLRQRDYCLSLPRLSKTCLIQKTGFSFSLDAEGLLYSDYCNMPASEIYKRCVIMAGSYIV
jgi:hypothetical protein